MNNLQFPTTIAPWLLLQRLPGFSYRRFARLQQLALDPAALLLELPLARLAANLPATMTERIVALRRAGARDPLWQQMLHDVDCCQRLSIHVVRYGDAQYPALLQHTASAPPLLFVRGRVDVLQSSQLAIVGARNATAGGLDCATKFARSLCQRGLTITSGLALGIDAAAHQGALDVGGSTIAVLGTGVDVIYPRSNLKLAQAIVESGALVSELPLGSPPRREHFPQRNRLISGLAHGVLVVEAAVQSGSLITAHFAAEQGREVFAVPGSIHNPMARGCHALIRNGARLVETVDDIVDELAAPLQLPLTTIKSAPEFEIQPGLALTDMASESVDGAADNTLALAALTAEARSLFSHLRGEPLPMDLLLAKSGLAATALSCALLELELAGLAIATPAGYQRQSQRLPTHET